MSENITKQNRILLYFRNVKLVHTPVMKMASFIDHPLSDPDNLYIDSNLFLQFREVKQ